MNNSFFFPKAHNPTFDASKDFQVLMAGAQSSFKADIAASEVCLTKCNPDFSQQ